MAADSLALRNGYPSIWLRLGGADRRQGVAMAVLLVLVCWAGTVLYFFGRKIVALYDVLLSMFTHFIPLGPIALIAFAVALIVLFAPKRTAD